MKNHDRPRFAQVYATSLTYAIPLAKNVVRRKAEQIHHVVILAGPNAFAGDEFPSVLVVPLSPCVQYASDCDLIVPEEENPAGFKAMIEFWNITPMLTRNLGNYKGSIVNPVLLDGLELLWRREYGLSASPAALNKLPIGSPFMVLSEVVETFRDHERRAVSYLREPVDRLLGTLTK